MREIIYDIECYPNYFLVLFKEAGVPGFLGFEISSRHNDAYQLYEYLKDIIAKRRRMTGFNNIGYDYVLLHYFFYSDHHNLSGEEIAANIYALSCAIINSVDTNEFSIKERHHFTKQIDLYKIHHFDNKAKKTSLKALEFVMRMKNLEDLPFPVGIRLTPEQMDITANYCCNDIEATETFYNKSKEDIEFRETLGEDWLNYSDAKIGKMYFQRELEAAMPGITRGSTTRHTVNLSDIIFPWITFNSEPFQRALLELKSIVVYAADVKKSFDGLSIYKDGFTFKFGLGGMHGSAPKGVYRTTADREIRDIDVVSYYPSIAIQNQLGPEHLGSVYCDVNERLLAERKSHAKGTPTNKRLKLSLNASWGDSGNRYGIFFDVGFLLSVSVNGQLMLCILAEALMEIPGLQIIQANTDGLTIDYPISARAEVERVCAWWEAGTRLELERVNYSAIWIRDVNNYVAQSDKGKLKTKGAYEYENLDWHKNHSSLVIPRAAVAAMTKGYDLHAFIAFEAMRDPWSFLILGKAPRNCQMLWGDERVQRITRYYVSTSGRTLTKVMPPLAGKTEERYIAQQKGQLVQLVNRYDGQPLTDLNIDWYVKEARKLVISS